MAVEKILLQFEADIKDLKSELNQVKGKLSDTEKEGKKVGSSLSKSFTNVGKAIGAAFSVNVLIQFAKKSIELYDIQAKAEAQLLQALKGREDIQKRLILQAGQLQKITLFGDEATIQAQAMLAKFGMTEAQIKRLIPLIQDYATVSGQDLASAADMVARSVGTSTNALTRYGIEINGAVGSAERLESAISSLNEMVGGQAVAAAKAGIGELQQMQNAWGDFAESVGEYIYPAITKLLKAGNKLVDILKLGGLGGILNLPDAWDDATIAADKYNREQERFIEYYEKNKGIFGSLEEAGKAYGEFLDGQIELISSQVDANGELTKSQQIEIDELYIAKEALSDYIEEMGGSIKITGDLTKKTLDLSESLDKLPKLVQSLYDPFNELPDVVERFGQAMVRIFGENEDPNQSVTDFYDNLIQKIEEADAANIDFFETIEENNGVMDNSILYAMQLSDALGMLQGSVKDIAGEQEKFTNFLQTISIAQILFARSVAIAEAVKGASVGLSEPGGLLKFLATTTFVIAQITGFIGDSLKTARGTQIPAYAKGVVDLKGDGTETSDSILARLSKGESVITAKGTKQDKKLFEAANKLMLDEYIHANYVLPALKDKQNSDKAMFDDYRLYRTLITGQKQDKEMNKQLIKVLGQRVNKHNNWA